MYDIMSHKRDIGSYVAEIIHDRKVVRRVYGFSRSEVLKKARRLRKQLCEKHGADR